MIIAIDGPAGAGKSTVAKLLAKKLHFIYLDTGAMYRALTLKIITQKIDINDVSAIAAVARDTRIELSDNDTGSLTVLLDGKNVSSAIREPRVTEFVSDVAKIKGVREVMLGLQRAFAQGCNCVADGRDTGTVVFPKAERKFFLDADFKERVKRRYNELIVKHGSTVTETAVAADLRNRDTIDSTREVAPLKKADDARYIDTTLLNIEEVVDVLFKLISE